MGVEYYLINHSLLSKFNLGKGPWNLEGLKLHNLLNDTKETLIDVLCSYWIDLDKFYCQEVIEKVKKFNSEGTQETISMMTDCNVESNDKIYKYPTIGTRSRKV